MRRKKVKPNYRKTILRLPDLDHSKSSVLNSLSSPGSRRAYGFAIDQFTPGIARNHVSRSIGRWYFDSGFIWKASAWRPRPSIRDLRQ